MNYYFILHISSYKYYPFGIRVRIGPHYLLLVAKDDEAVLRRSFGLDRNNKVCVSQQVRHDKNPSLLTGRKLQVKVLTLKPFGDKGDNSF